MADIEYMITKHSCQAMIDMNGGVCAQCGGKLTPIETVDNCNNPTYWAGCESCYRFDWGTPLIVHQIAKELVLNHNHICYSHMDRPEDKDEDYKKYWLNSQIEGTCSIVRKVLSIKKQIEELNKQP